MSNFENLKIETILLDLFAGIALSNIAYSDTNFWTNDDEEINERNLKIATKKVAYYCYKYAQAMLEERKKYIMEK